MATDASFTSALLLLSEPDINYAHLLLAAFKNDYRGASSLLTVNKYWARTIAADALTFKVMAVLIAAEAKLHYEPPQSLPKGESWRDVCRTLFAQRGVFCNNFGGVPAPPPSVQPFAISVGCRFRPPGGASSSGGVAAEEKEIVLPLHQRLRLIQQSTGCTLAEAKKLFWAGSSTTTKADPFASADAAVVVVAPPAEEAAPAIDVSEDAAVVAGSGGDDAASGGDKENLSNELTTSSSSSFSSCPSTSCCASHSSAASTAEENDDASSNSGSTAPSAAASGGGAGGVTTDAACGLISQHGGTAIICAPGAGLRAFDFAHTWGDGSTQKEVYEDAVAPLVSDVLNGRSACVLAYGQTGSGKTHTMTGTLRPQGSEQRGLIPRAVSKLLEAAESRSSTFGLTCKVSMACIEVFGTTVTDLLHDGTRVGGFWQGVSAAATAAGYADEVVETYGHALDLLERADDAKRRAATMMNERSSRAHSLIMLSLEQEDERPGSEDGGKVKSQLCLVDLGGCEKVKKSGATGERLQEAIHINTGLLALKSVITALNQQRSYVPYQDDKLTYLLKRSVAGGAKTCVLLAARPEAEHATETLQALRFGEACAQVEVAAHKSEGAGRAAAAALEALDAQIASLEEAIKEKERFETHVEKKVDERAGLTDAEGFGSALTDFRTYELKVSRIVGAEKERAQLEKVLHARRALVGEL